VLPHSALASGDDAKAYQSKKGTSYILFVKRKSKKKINPFKTKMEEWGQIFEKWKELERVGDVVD